MSFQTINPTTGALLRSFTELTDDQLTDKLSRAQIAFDANRRRSFAERARRMRAAGAMLEREKHELGKLMTTEMGKPIGAAVAEAEKCAWVCRYYADNAERFLRDENVDTGERRSYIRYQPIGAVLAIMPWNFPFWQVFRFAAPALMAGNVGLLKHASNVPQCALAIEDLLLRAGFQDGEFQTLLIGTDRVPRVLSDPRVRAVTLTGSDRAGAAVASSAGHHLKKSVLELGGSDPFIVMPSADVARAAEIAVAARTVNNGQSCIAAKRFIVADPVYDEFTRTFVARMAALRIGDPLVEDTQIGPLATESILDDLHEQVRASVQQGARVLTGGDRIDRPGYFYAPTVLADVPSDAPAYREELFGPVATLFRARDIDDAIRIANDSVFGLGSAAWTNDELEQRRFIDELETGLVFINGMVASDPRLPFGGVKRSGYGRELAEVGIREFTNIKSVVIEGVAVRHAAE